MIGIRLALSCVLEKRSRGRSQFSASVPVRGLGTNYVSCSGGDALRAYRQTICHGYAVKLILLPAVHVPAGIYPLPFAQHEDFGDAAGLVDVLAAGIQLVRVV